MHLTLTVVDPTSAHPARDLDVLAPPGATLGDVRRDLLAAVGQREGPLHCGARALSDQSVLGRPPLVSGAVVTIGECGAPPAAGMLELRVTAGLDAGGVHRLTPGDHVIGRGVEAEVRINDPQLSRAHALVRVAAESSSVVDLGSANGTLLGSEPLTDQPRRLRPGDVLRVGDSALELALPALRSLPPRLDDDGHPLVARPPRLGDPPRRERRRLPTLPVARDPARLPLLALAIPALLGAGLLLVTRNPTYLLFVLLSPVTALGSWTSDRVDRRRTLRRDRASYDEARARLRQEVAEIVARQQRERHDRFPSLAHLATRARSPDLGLWERGPGDPDFLVVRLGLGTVPAAVDLVGDDDRLSPDAADPATAALPEALLRDAPVTVSLVEHAPVGIAGPLSVTAPLVRSLVIQLGCLHGPSALPTRVLSSGPAEAWAWQRWLPHAAPETARLEQWLAELDRRTGDSRAAPLRHASQVLVLDGSDVLGTVDGAHRLLSEGPAVGLYVVVVARSARDLPAQCRAVVEATGGEPARLTVRRRDAPEVTDVRPDGVSRGHAENVARAMAPLREAASAEAVGVDLPRDVRLATLLGGGAFDPALLAQEWASARAPAPVPLGRGPRGAPVTVDLVADGPHLLIAGTTGSGKSELLQSFIAALAVTNRPDELGFVLVDFKGGAAFRECADLPHTVGLVTDLDAHLAERLLRSLRGLVTARERRLADAGASDIDQYTRVAGRAALPRIVVVVDEFATLSDELPDVVAELVSIARRGRSLGLHLVLATQRPSGVVSAEIRANMGARLCLRVSESAESVDVVDVTDAASISATLPGRGWLRRPGGGLEAVQVARVSRVTSVSGATVRVRPAWEPEGGEAPATVPESTMLESTEAESTEAESSRAESSDLCVLVATTQAAAATLSIAPATSPWLPPLPDDVSWAELEAIDDTAGDVAVRRRSVALGLVDRPEHGDRTTFRIDPTGGANVLVVGAPRSGRSQALLTLAGRLCATTSPDDLHVYALDGNSRALSALAGLAHCGCVAPPDDPDLAARVLSRLVDELGRRERAEGPDSAAVLLVVDDWTSWRPVFEHVDGGAPVEHLMRLARSGTAVGMRVALTAEREVLGSRFGDAFPDRVVLRLADRVDYALAGVAPRAVPGRLPPGRGVLPGVDREVQLAYTTVDQLRRSAWLRDTEHPLAVRRPPLQLRAVPELVSHRELSSHGPAAPGRLVIGLGGDQATPVSFDVRDGRALLVVGPPRSGRSALLRLAATTFVAAGQPVAVLAPARSPLLHAPGVTVLDPHDRDALVCHLALTPRPVVLVDDAEAFHDAPVDDLLAAALGRGAPDSCTVLLAGSVDDLAARFRGFAVEARRHRCGLLLGAYGPAEGELLGVRLPRHGAGPPGRGLLVVPGRCTPVQVGSVDH